MAVAGVSPECLFSNPSSSRWCQSGKTAVARSSEHAVHAVAKYLAILSRVAVFGTDIVLGILVAVRSVLCLHESMQVLGSTSGFGGSQTTGGRVVGAVSAF